MKLLYLSPEVDNRYTVFSNWRIAHDYLHIRYLLKDAASGDGARGGLRVHPYKNRVRERIRFATDVSSSLDFYIMLLVYYQEELS